MTTTTTLPPLPDLSPVRRAQALSLLERLERRRLRLDKQTYRHLSQHCGLTRREVQKAAEHLEREGLITVEAQGGVTVLERTRT